MMSGLPASSAAEPVRTPASLDIMIGQMIMVGFKGTQPGDPWPTKLIGQIAAGKVGGVLFLGRNVASREAVRALNEAFMGAGAIPVLLALDQEGGIIERLTWRVGFLELPSARDMAKTESVAKAGELYAGLAKALRDWKFNLNLGPVVDVDVNPDNPIIGGLGRSFSADPAKVTAYGSAFIKGHHANGMLTALKHFPGHGSSRDDSHKGFVDVSRTWTPAELAPYRDLISAGLVDMVMTGHLYIELLAAQDSKLPASLSGIAVDLLRNDLGFQGVVISDDMEMKAIEADYSVEEAAIAAVRAGTNILVYSNYANPRPDLPDTIIAVLKREALADPQFLGLIEDSYGKIMRLKAKLQRADAG